MLPRNEMPWEPCCDLCGTAHAECKDCGKEICAEACNANDRPSREDAVCTGCAHAAFLCGRRDSECLTDYERNI